MAEGGATLPLGRASARDLDRTQNGATIGAQSQPDDLARTICIYIFELFKSQIYYLLCFRIK